MQGGNNRHPELADQGKQKDAVIAAEDAVFMLEADNVRVVAVEEIRRPPVGIQVVFLYFKAHPVRIGVSFGYVGNGKGETGKAGVSGGNGLAEARGKGGNAALPGQVIADKGNVENRIIHS
jgi:hypothetical protein